MRFRLILAALAATGAFVGAAFAVPVPPTAPARAAGAVDPRPEVVIAVRTDVRAVALSFDDGPDPRWTPHLLDAMRVTGAKATFFVTGEHVRAHPDIARRIVAEGSELANHTHDHPVVDELSGAAVSEQVYGAAQAMRDADVPQTGYFRPPKGRFDQTALAAVSQAGLRTIGWTVCIEKWLKRLGPEAGVDEVVRRVAPGGVIVGHDGGIPDRSQTVATLPALLARLDAAGYRVVTISELLRLGDPVMGQPGSLPDLGTSRPA